MRSNSLAALAATALGLFGLARAADAQVAPNPPAADAAPPAAPAPGTGAVSDPWERTNRALYRFNQKIDPVLIRPGAVFYHHAVPTPLRTGVRNMLSNLTHPVIAMNDLAQGKPVTAGRTVVRFVANSVLGVGGFFDVAASGGLPYHGADFGQTLGRYGVGTGPYVYLPLLGPTTVRDIAGRGVDSFADPFNVVNYEGRTALSLSRAGTGALDARGEADPLLKDINRTATDPYVTTRSLYLQNRRAFVRGEAVTAQSVKDLPDFNPEGRAPTNSASPAPRSTTSTPGPQ